VIPAAAPHLTAAVESHPGETGKNNEDRHSLTGYLLPDGETRATLAVVADGIGGHLAGEVAAQVAIETFVGKVATYEDGDPTEILRTAVVEAGRAVAEASLTSPEREGMGSTLSAVWVIGRRLYTVTIGDSRIYLLRAGRLTQTSIDHTWVQEAIDHKIIPPGAAHSHPNAHVLRRHLGGRLEPQPDFRLRLSPSESDEVSASHQGHLLEPGDQIFLCSDGLTDLVQDYEIAGSLRKRSPHAAAHYLVDLARARGGFDNITAMVLVVPGRPRRGGCAAWLRLLVAAGISTLLLVTFVLATVAGAWWLGVGPFERITPAAVPPSPTQTVPATPSPSLTPEPSATFTPTPGPTETPTSEGTASSSPEPSATAPSPTVTSASSETPSG
jgi:protein phosphatase